MLTPDQLSDMRQVITDQFTGSASSIARKRAENFLNRGIISSPTFPDVHFETNMWLDRDKRSHERFLHGFIFFNDWYRTILADPDLRDVACKASLKIVDSWITFDLTSGTEARMAYHDETTAQRLINLLQLDAVISKTYPEESSGLLRPLMDRTANLLTEPGFHSAGNNHGMFQDLALLYYSVLVDWITPTVREQYLSLAFSRLMDYFSSCFTNEGVHRENTPTYHLMVSRHLSVVHRLSKAAGHMHANFYEHLLAKAESYATHALMPNGLYPPVSDTTQRSVNNEGALNVFKSPEFLYAASSGRQGRAPAERTLVLPESGYMIYRSSWADPDATYAFFSAAYNADYHKHSDDLSLYLRSKGIDLLSESGPYSYDYKDPLSRYAYSQFAHNSLVVDGASLPRTDGKSRSVKLSELRHDSDQIVVEGINERYDDTKHVRHLEIEESSGHPCINIVDTIVSGEDHKYQLLWNLGTDVSVVLHGQGFELFHKQGKVMDLAFTADVPTRVSIQRGRLKPRPLGWTFPKFGQAVPSDVVQIEFEGRHAEISTRIRVSNFSYRDRGINGTNAWKRFQGKVPLNYLYSPPKSGRAAKLAVVFSAIHEPGDFTYNYKATIDRTDTAALYILDDFGDQGAYYYSDHRSTAIFQTVQELLLKITSESGVDRSDVATFGSSKGGSAAVIHGLAFGAGKIFVGAPQMNIGSFLKDWHPNIVRFMAGGESDVDIKYLDSIIPSILRSRPRTQTSLSIIVGESDHHYINHVVPLVRQAQEMNVEAHAIVLAGTPHAEIGKMYKLWVQATIDQWVRETGEEALPYEITEHAASSLKVDIFSPRDAKHAYRLYRGREIVQSIGYTKDRSATFNGLPPGIYRVRVFTRLSPSNLQSSFTTRGVRVQGDNRATESHF